MRYLLTFIAGMAIAIAWSTMWDLLLGLPMTFFRLKEKDRTSIRERQIGMGQLRWILTVGVLRSGLAAGFAVVTFDLLIDRSARDLALQSGPVCARVFVFRLFLGRVELGCH